MLFIVKLIILNWYVFHLIVRIKKKYFKKIKIPGFTII